MAQQTYCKIVDGEIVAREMKDSPEVATGKDGNPVWRPLSKTARPLFNPATHHAPIKSERIEADRVVEVWTVPAAKTAQDLAADKRAQVEAMGDVNLSKLLDLENRIRALEGKDGVTEEDLKQDIEGHIKAVRA